MPIHRALSHKCGRLTAGILLMLLAIGVTQAQEPKGPFLELIEVVPDTEYYDRWKSVTPGNITMELWGATSEHSWSEPPAVIDGNGFDLTLTAQGFIPKEQGNMVIGTSFSSQGFSYEATNRGPYFAVPAGQSASDSMTVHLTPTGSEGSVAELYIGASFGPGVRYRYRVSDTPVAGSAAKAPGQPQPPAQAALSAELDCPGSIVISRLPSLNCHIIITGFERNTATPVEVILPEAVDLAGNHGNGIQIDGDGENDVFNWDQSYSWGLFVFACPGQQGAAVNCHGSETAPGPQTVPILVRQGEREVLVPLLITAVPGDTRINIAGDWSSTFGAMQLSGNNNIEGTYDFNGGMLQGALEGTTFIGYWAQPLGAGQTCDDRVLGTHFWGRVVFEFAPDGDSFTGRWGYCGQEPTRPDWDGSR